MSKKSSADKRWYYRYDDDDIRSVLLDRNNVKTEYIYGRQVHYMMDQRNRIDLRLIRNDPTIAAKPGSYFLEDFPGQVTVHITPVRFNIRAPTGEINLSVSEGRVSTFVTIRTPGESFRIDLDRGYWPERLTGVIKSQHEFHTVSAPTLKREELGSVKTYGYSIPVIVGLKDALNILNDIIAEKGVTQTHREHVDDILGRVDKIHRTQLSKVSSVQVDKIYPSGVIPVRPRPIIRAPEPPAEELSRKPSRMKPTLGAGPEITVGPTPEGRPEPYRVSFQYATGAGETKRVRATSYKSALQQAENVRKIKLIPLEVEVEKV